MANSDVVAITISRKLAEQIEAYAALKNQSVEQVLTSGIQWWLETRVEAEIEHIVETTAAQLQYERTYA